MFNTQMPSGGLNNFGGYSSDPNGFQDPNGMNGPNGRILSTVLRVARPVVIVLFVALALWCLSKGCEVLPIFMHPFVDGMPDGISKDVLLKSMDVMGIVHTYTWKLFVWVEPAAARSWAVVTALWDRFIAWVSGLPG